MFNGKKTLAGLIVGGSLLLLASSAGATIIGKDSFDYPDGDIGGQAGGVGWTYELTDEAAAPPSAPSNWNVTSGTPTVVGGALVTTGAGARREYNGLTEGVNGSNEREGALRGVGKVYYGVRMTRDANVDWGGVSGYDFGDERIFFGVPGAQGADKVFGIEESGVSRTLGTVPVVPGQSYYLVAMIDFDNDLLALWVDPTPDDELNPDVTRPYAGTNWNTAVRLASGGSGSTIWDDLTVATTFAEAVPEPSSLALFGGLTTLLTLRRRRR